MSTKMRDMLIAPIADYSQTLANILHHADITAFNIQAADRFKTLGGTEEYEEWKAKAKESLERLKNTVAVLEGDIERL